METRWNKFEYETGATVRMSDGTEYIVDTNGWRCTRFSDRKRARAERKTRRILKDGGNF